MPLPGSGQGLRLTRRAGRGQREAPGAPGTPTPPVQGTKSGARSTLRSGTECTTGRARRRLGRRRGKLHSGTRDRRGGRGQRRAVQVRQRPLAPAPASGRRRRNPLPTEPAPRRTFTGGDSTGCAGLASSRAGLSRRRSRRLHALGLRCGPAPPGCSTRPRTSDAQPATPRNNGALEGSAGALRTVRGAAKAGDQAGGGRRPPAGLGA
mmetsp:Transcript_9444/g.36865  ORF Transcript_9444/g.36865 Transcript_9444/m.36865 type:complete len:208 (-) Transcript_9444:144-767(-)